MKQLLYIFLCAIMAPILAKADKVETINIIKKDNAFLYSDVTLPTREEATSQAYVQLQREVLEWLSTEFEEGVDGITAVAVNRLADTIMTRRVEMFRVFAYVKKTEIIRQFGLNKEATDSLGLSHSHSNDTVANERVRILLQQSFYNHNSFVLNKLKKAKTFFDLKNIMEPLKQSGSITDYGKYATSEKPEDCYLVVYDPAGNIRAILSPGDEERLNLQTGSFDSISNYRGCGAIWFKLNN